MALTTTSSYAGLVKTAYDKYVEFALRSVPLYRQFATKRPVDVDKPGSSVVFSLYADLADATSTLTEGTDVTPVAPSDVSTVTVTLAEQGNVVTRTTLLEAESFTNVDPALANMIAFNMASSLDTLVRTKAIAGSNVVYSNAGAVDATGPTNTLVSTDVFSSTLGRYTVAKLRGNSAVPIKGTLYGAIIHPDVSYDLRSETGAAAWRDPHNYQSAGNIWAGEIGAYEGAFYIETPRAYQATDGSASAKVSRTLFLGDQAIAEAVAVEPQVVIGPVVDSLMRNRPIGWKALIGWSVYRQPALYRVETGSSI